MNRKILTGLFFALIGVGMSFEAFNYSNLPPVSRTGAPGESNCTSCHSGTAQTNSNLLTLVALDSSQTPVTTLAPGKSYTMKLSLNVAATMYGFELTN